MYGAALLLEGERLVAEVVCLRCGYGAISLCSDGWNGAAIPVPTVCRDCGGPLVTVSPVAGTPRCSAAGL